jgi:hypothetical protein
VHPQRPRGRCRPGHRPAPLDGRQFLYANYRDSELGYAVTDHTAQGRTVHAGLAVITGTEDRQHAYVALTRGADRNTAYVFTLSPKRADPAPAPRPAPELARYDRVTTLRSGQWEASAADGAPADPLGVLAGVLEREGWPAAVRLPDPAAGPGRRRPPGGPERDLDRRDRPGPRPAIHRTVPAGPAAGE